MGYRKLQVSYHPGFRLIAAEDLERKEREVALQFIEVSDHQFFEVSDHQFFKVPEHSISGIQKMKYGK